jgi:hypothetical protein
MDIIARLLNILMNARLKDVSQLSLEEIRDLGKTEIRSGLAMCSSLQTMTEVHAALDLVKNGYAKLECYMTRSSEINVHDVPVFDKVPKEYWPKSVVRDLDKKRYVLDFLNEQKKKLGMYLLDNVSPELFNRYDCPECTGNCPIQLARFPSISYRRQTTIDEPLIVPCVTQETKKLKLYEISDFHYVSCFLIFHSVYPNLEG